MALNAKQKEGIQLMKEALDKLEVLKDRYKVGAMLPSEVKEYHKYKEFQCGHIWGFLEGMIFQATEKQAEEINKEIKKYIDKIPKQ